MAPRRGAKRKVQQKNEKPAKKDQPPPKEPAPTNKAVQGGRRARQSTRLPDLTEQELQEALLFMSGRYKKAQSDSALRQQLSSQLQENEDEVSSTPRKGSSASNVKKVGPYSRLGMGGKVSSKRRLIDADSDDTGNDNDEEVQPLPPKRPKPKKGPPTSAGSETMVDHDTDDPFHVASCDDDDKDKDYNVADDEEDSEEVPEEPLPTVKRPLKRRAVAPTNYEMSEEGSKDMQVTPKKTIGQLKSRPSTPGSGRQYFKDNEVLERLCVLWEAVPHLYDKGHKLYKDPTARWSAIGKIADELGIPAFFVNMRMSSLRTDYQKIVSGKVKSGSSAAEGKLPYKKELIKRLCHFLDPYCKKEESMTNYRMPSKLKAQARQEEVDEENYDEENQGEAEGDTGHHGQQEDEEGPEVTEIVDDADESEDDAVSTRTRNSPNKVKQRSETVTPPTTGKGKGPGKSSAKKVTPKSTPGGSGPSKPTYKKVGCTAAGTSGKAVKDRQVSGGRKTYDTEYLREKEKFHETDDEVTNEYFKNKEPQHLRNVDKKNKSVAEVLESREKYFEKCTESVVDLTRLAAARHLQPQPVAQADPESEDSHWSKMILFQCARMTQKVRDKFKHHVHGLALDAVNGDWKP